MPYSVPSTDELAAVDSKVDQVKASVDEAGIVAGNALSQASQAASLASGFDERLSGVEAELAALGGPVGGNPPPAASAFTGFIHVDSYPGNDDQKLAAAMNAAKATSLKPLLILSARAWRFTKPIDAYTGFGLTGPTWRAVEQQRSGNPYPCLVRLNVEGGTAANPQPWLRFQSGNTFGCYIGNLTFEGNSGTIGIGSVNGGVAWTMTLHNLSFTNFASNLGYPGRKLLLTACTFSGYWNQNNHYVSAAVIGGSDNSLWMDGSLIDSPPHIRGEPAGEYNLILDYMSKSVIGPLYMTCDRGSGIKVIGSSSTQGNTIIQGARIEGRNRNTPCYGALVRVEGGGITLRDCWLGYAMKNPSAGSNPSDRAVVEVSGSGEAVLGSIQYGLAEGVPLSTPLARANGPEATVVQEGYVSIHGDRRAKPTFAVSNSGAVLDALGNSVPGVKTI